MKLYQRTFQTEYPAFVKRDFMAHGRKWTRGSEFTWREFGIAPEKVEWLYKRGFLFHKDIAAPKAEPKPVVEEKETTDNSSDSSDLESMNKNDLIEFGRSLDLQVNNTMPKDVIKDKILAALAV